ncbi:MAG: N-acetyl-gamma-glutamyl-phosphate reductase [Phycisphaerae bacterium]|jgi:N-acetyl-gamma-glutamyl-phosphate reductase|nr:N-acetyl-gamma-glutamyl-phosphate reductase [Phycisphaerae bacterium]
MTQSDRKIRVVLIGGSGYAGFEVVRWLLRHPNAKLVGVFGPSNELGPMEQFYPLLSAQTDLVQELFDADRVANIGADLAMLCVPHKVAMSYVPTLRAAGLRIIDWSADYRLTDAAVYEKWYSPHTDPDGLTDAVYGLPEYYRDAIAQASLVANPGCYPTCSILAIAPLLRAGLIKPDGIVINAISGVSGAGRTPHLKFHFPERNENFEPYGVGTHRHMPEIEQVLSDVSGQKAAVLFQPHLSPMDRGMLCSIYADPVDDVTDDQLTGALVQAYADEPFVRVRTDVLPASKYVATTNFCDVSADMVKGKVVLFSALDNVIKGASGQAIQNMNIMFGLDETTGLY